MNGKVSKMLHKMNANDNRTKKIWGTLTDNQRNKIRSVYKEKGPGPAVVEMTKQIGNIKD